jgi:hypothetical protein
LARLVSSTDLTKLWPMVEREKLPSRTLPEVIRLLKAAGMTQRKLQEAGIGTLAARKLIGQRDGEVTVEVMERALAIIGRELVARQRRRGK